MICNLKQAVCDACGCGIDHNRNTTTKELNKRIKKYGSIVLGRRHFCDRECYEKWVAKRRTQIKSRGSKR